MSAPLGALTAPDPAGPGRRPLSGRGLVWRVVVLAALFAGAQPFLWLGLTMLELAGSRYGFWWVLLVEAPWVLVTWWVLARARRPMLTLGAASLVVVVAALVIPTVSTPAPDRVQLTADRLPVPPDWVVIENVAHGNSLCFDVCPSLTRTYSTPVTGDEPHGVLAAALDAHGWRRLDYGWARGRFTIVIADRDAELSAHDLDAQAWNRVTVHLTTTG
ncbi:hypothetical protein [Cellulomonas sp. URHB0016]